MEGDTAKVVVPILPLAVSPSILPSTVIVSEILWTVIYFPFFLSLGILSSDN